VTARDHDEQAESLGAYALGALPALEAQVFERHLMGCTACQDELQRLNAAAGALPRAVTPYRPPASLKESLMATVRADVARAEPEPERAAAPPRRTWFPRLRPALAVATAVAVGALAVLGLSVDGDDARTVTAQVDETRLPRAAASLSIPEGDEGALLRVEGLPDPGRERVYQVWVQRGEDVVPVSIFSVDASGAGTAGVPGSLSGVDKVMVTRERRGGAAAPTEEPVLSVEV
jgi:anti-sigma-K factor RskA